MIEDCAESHGATCRGRMTGSFGDMACFSFYANKIITTGEGGMVVDQRRRARRAAAAAAQSRVHASRVSATRCAAYNFRMTGYQAALGVAQLEKIDEIIEKKRGIAREYTRAPGRTFPGCGFRPR